jgi:hypothetical protein
MSEIPNPSPQPDQPGEPDAATHSFEPSWANEETAYIPVVTGSAAVADSYATGDHPSGEDATEADEDAEDGAGLARRLLMVGGVPFVLVAVAIALVAGSAITWVISPNWGKTNVAAPARNVGVVPNTSAPSKAKLITYLSPNRIVIPAIHASAPVQNMGELPNRELDIPLNPLVVGWWDGGAHPGAPVGSAVIAGHINYAGVTGAMAHIGYLDPGNKIYVSGQLDDKAKTLEFSVTGVRTYRKVALPFAQIFSQTVAGRLVVVTCGGPFDEQTGNYLDNIVVYAVPVTKAPAAKKSGAKQPVSTTSVSTTATSK